MHKLPAKRKITSFFFNCFVNVIPILKCKL